jgi:hypothetical protein
MTTLASYDQQRYERLTECLDEYLCSNGPNDGQEALLKDLHRALISLEEWPKKQLKDIEQLRKRFF